MSDPLNHPTASNRWRRAREVLAEAVAVAIAGAALALVANAVSPRGLVLVKNYFPGPTNGVVTRPIAVVWSPTNPPAQQLSAVQLAENGFQSVDRDRAASLLRNPRFHQQGILFIDARDEERYREGHIPGAYELDPYRPERRIADVLPLCQIAETVVIYCSGGDCEDSLFAAIVLRDAGIANQKLFIYTGGISDWATNGLPVEIGERNSGDVRPREK